MTYDTLTRISVTRSRGKCSADRTGVYTGGGERFVVLGTLNLSPSRRAESQCPPARTVLRALRLYQRPEFFADKTKVCSSRGDVKPAYRDWCDAYTLTGSVGLPPFFSSISAQANLQRMAITCLSAVGIPM